MEEMSIDKALELAAKSNNNLVAMNNDEKPVCKIMNYGKYMYEQQKKAKRKTAMQRLQKQRWKRQRECGKKRNPFVLRHSRSWKKQEKDRKASRQIHRMKKKSRMLSKESVEGQSFE